MHGQADVIVIVPDGLSGKIAAGQAADLEIVYNSADDRGKLAYGRVSDIVSRWKENVHRAAQEGRQAERLRNAHERRKVRDVATARESNSQLWSRMLPFLLILMSLTGAFYPAIVFCAGEKERGTMETLLISPARRRRSFWASS